MIKYEKKKLSNFRKKRRKMWSCLSWVKKMLAGKNAEMSRGHFLKVETLERLYWGQRESAWYELKAAFWHQRTGYQRVLEVILTFPQDLNLQSVSTGDWCEFLNLHVHPGDEQIATFSIFVVVLNLRTYWIYYSFIFLTRLLYWIYEFRKMSLWNTKQC